MKDIRKRIVSFLIALLLVGSMVSATGVLEQAVRAYAQDYIYYGTLDIKDKGWTQYNTGLNYDMTGGTAGTIYQGAKLAVIDEKINKSGNKVSYVYSEDLGKNCYVATKCIKAMVSSSEPTPAPVQIADAYRIVGANYLRIRSNPGVKYSILGTIPCNAKVIVTEYNNGWGKTTYEGKTGWISLDYTKREELRDGIYRIIPKCAPSCVLGLSGNGTEDGTNVEIQERQEGDSQLFAVSKMADGSYLIRNVLSDKMLDVASGSTETGGNIQVYTDNGTSAQKWILSARENNYYIVRSICSDLALDVSGGLDASGTNIQQWDLNYSDAQLFQFEPAGQREIQAKIEELFVKLGGDISEFVDNGVAKACYFTFSGEPCKRVGKKHIGNDAVWSVIRADWFKNIFEVEKLGGDKQFPDVNQFPKHTVSGKSGAGEKNSGSQCFGFACFAQWYLYQESNRDYVQGSRVGQGKWGAEFLQDYAQPGDVLRVLEVREGVHHSMVVYAIDDEGITVLDCNNCGEPCRVALQKIEWKKWSGKTVYVYRVE